MLDITGTERLFGPSAQLAERMRSALASSGFHVSIAVSAKFHTARMKAAATRGTTIVAMERKEQALAKLPITIVMPG